jgi:hypothetical protein
MATNEAPDEASQYHALSEEWILWYHPPTADWTPSSYVKIGCLKNVEQTITTLESLPVKLVINSSLFIMRKGVMPIWEDPKNRNGGYISYKIPNAEVPITWREVVYSLVGNTISSQKSFITCVNGASLAPKRGFCILKIWQTNCDNQNPAIITNAIKGINESRAKDGVLFSKWAPEY